jgi:hypothetical protein
MGYQISNICCEICAAWSQKGPSKSLGHGRGRSPPRYDTHGLPTTTRYFWLHGRGPYMGRDRCQVGHSQRAVALYGRLHRWHRALAIQSREHMARHRPLLRPFVTRPGTFIVINWLLHVNEMILVKSPSYMKLLRRSSELSNIPAFWQHRFSHCSHGQSNSRFDVTDTRYRWACQIRGPSAKKKPPNASTYEQI